jgi:hypothetical protein
MASKVIDIQEQARLLADDNRKAEPAITTVFWFPDPDEVRLVEVHSGIAATPEGPLHPFFFRESPDDNLPAPSGIVLVRPEEVRQRELPEEWGSWEDGIEL